MKLKEVEEAIMDPKRGINWVIEKFSFSEAFMTNFITWCKVKAATIIPLSQQLAKQQQNMIQQQLANQQQSLQSSALGKKK